MKCSIVKESVKNTIEKGRTAKQAAKTSVTSPPNELDLCIRKKK